MQLEAPGSPCGPCLALLRQGEAEVEAEGRLRCPSLYQSRGCRMFGVNSAHVDCPDWLKMDSKPRGADRTSGQ